MRRTAIQSGRVAAADVRRTARRRARITGVRPGEPLEPRRLLSTVYVDDSATGGADTGADWANAFTSLQAALRAADRRPAGTALEIRVARGTYAPGPNRTDTFSLREGVALRGGYAGVGSPDPDARDVARFTTTLSGEVGSPATNADNSFHVVTAVGVGRGAVLDGFTLTGGNADLNDFGPNSGGGGLYVVSASPTVAHCTIAGNRAQLMGGGVRTFQSAPAFIDCTIADNYAGQGGGAYNQSSAPQMTRCTFARNTCNVSSSGGGMTNLSSSPTLTDCTFVENVSGGDGGGMANYLSSPRLAGCTFRNNVAGVGGGAMHNATTSSPSVANCTFEGNSARARAGAVANVDRSFPAFTNCAFSGNSAGNEGGAVRNDDSSPVFTNCTFAANSAPKGGAVFNYLDASPSLINCVLWGNTAGQAVFDGLRSRTTVCRSLVQGGWPGAGNFSADPLFVRSPSPGPDGVWDTAQAPSADDDYGDLRPGLGSPMVDAGDTAAVPPGVTTDRAGNPRVVGASVDVGAYEQQPPAGTRLYQAEQAALGGGAVVSHDQGGYVGTGYVDYINASGDFVEFTVDGGATGGRHVLEFRYANGSAAARTMALRVNGAAPSDGGGTVTFAPTGSWVSWKIARVAVMLAAGTNQVRLLATGQSGPNLDSLAVVPAPVPPAAPVCQAESARLAGAIVASTVPGYGGTGYADYQRAGGEFVEFTIDVPAAGTYALDFRYANGSTADRPLALSLDGQAPTGSPVSFAPTGSWSVWGIASRSVALTAGRHTVRLTSIGQSGPNLDALVVRQATTPPPPSVVTLEAETATRRQGAVVGSNNPGYTGTGFVDYINASGDWVEWTVDGGPAGGAYELTFRFANGGATDRPLELKVNGTVVRPALSFPRSLSFGAGWSDWRTVTVTVPLNAGANTVRLTAIGQSGPNLDSLTVRPAVTAALT